MTSRYRALVCCSEMSIVSAVFTVFNYEIGALLVFTYVSIGSN